jgi:hypothetical protein
MGTSLTGQQIKNTYKSLIKTSDSTEASATAKLLSDGNGNDFGVYIDTDGVFGIGSAPSYSLDVSSRTDGVALPVGTTANRPTPTNGLLRYNSTIGKIEFYDGGWKTVFTTSGGTIDGSLIVTGDLTIQGTTVTLNTETVQFEDNILLLNRASADTQYDATNAGIEIEKTSANNPSFLYTYSSSTWGLTDSLIIEGGLTVDTNTLYVDSANNRVGIGTLNPANGTLQIDSSANQISIETGTSGDGRLHIGHFTNGTFIGTYGDDGGVADIIRFGTHSGDERMRIHSGGDVSFRDTSNNEAFYWDASAASLGIGSGITTSKLAVSGSMPSAGTPLIQFNETSGGARDGIYLDYTGTTNSAVYSLKIADATKTHLAVRGDGNVGIGVSPLTELHVKGSAEILRIEDSSDTGSPFMTFFQNGTRRSLIQHIDSGDTLSLASEYGNIRFMTGTDGTEVERMRVHSGGDIAFRDTSNNEAFYWDASTARLGIGTGSSPARTLEVNSGTASDIAKIGNNNGAFTFGYSTSLASIDLAASNAFRIRQGAVVPFYINTDGNVGIGTDSPVSGYILHAAGSIYANDAIQIGSNGSAATPALRINDGDTGLFRPEANTLAISTAGTERVRITSGGKLFAFNTTIDIDNLVTTNANSNNYIEAANFSIGSGNNGLHFGVTSTINERKTWIQSGHNDTNYAQFTGSISLNPLGGNVGIGTTNPSSDISGSATVLEIQDSNIASLALNHGTTGKFEVAASSLGLYFGHNGNSKMIIDSSGNVTIGSGTTTPQKLEVYGIDSTAYNSGDDNAQRSNGATIAITNNNGTVNSFAQLIFDTAGTNQSIARIVAIRTGTSSNDMAFVVEGGNTKREAMRITSGGRIFFYNLLGSSDTQSDVRYNATTKELFYNTSSERYKTNITDLESTLGKINNLRTVRYQDVESQNYSVGLIAEEVVEVIPDVVFNKEIEGYDTPQPEGINYSDFAPFLIKAIQEQQEIINDLKARIETLENQ